MIKIGLLSATPDPLLRQTRNSSGRWGNYQFSWANDANEDFEACFVFDDVALARTVRCRAGNLFLVTWEPPSIKGYSARFLKQFDGILTFRSDIQHHGLKKTAPMLPWWAGTSGGHGHKVATLCFDDLVDLDLTEKKAAVSCVCSKKTLTEGHRKRLKFVLDLKKILGEKLEVFGLEYQEPWPDKMTQISPFQYHLAIENSSVKDYWTEKVSDCFLGGALLLYHGCPNLGEYFPIQSHVVIDFDSAEATAATINNLLNGNAFAERKCFIDQARNDVLYKYNLFAQLAAFCGENIASLSLEQKSGFVFRAVSPSSAFRIKQSFLKRVCNRLAKLFRE